MPTFESRTRKIGNSITRPKARNSVVMKLKYASAVSINVTSEVWKLYRNPDA